MTTAEEVQGLFNRIAPIYDSINFWLSFGQHWVWKQMTVSWSKAKEGDTALDLCCGSGDLTRLLAKQVGKTGQVYGVDFSCELLAVARSKGIPYGTIIHWLEGNALAIPFPDHTFDCATMGYGLRNVSDIPLALQELYRVLKPSATVAILDFNHPNNLWVQKFQEWYLNRLVVPIAQQLGVKEDYAYILPSLDRFPTAEEQIKLGYSIGFRSVTHYAIAEGLMGVLVLQK